MVEKADKHYLIQMIKFNINVINHVYPLDRMYGKGHTTSLFFHPITHNSGTVVSKTSDQFQ